MTGRFGKPLWKGSHVGARTTTRQKMLVSAVELLRERGAAAVTVDAVLARSQAPRGSVYHHFPGGRGEIMSDALALAGDAISSLIEQASTEGASAGLRRFGDFWSAILHDSDFGSGCPVMSVAVGGSPDDQQLHAAATDIFQRWQHALERGIRADGVEAARAHRLATIVLAALEGAVVLCRAQRSTQPLDEVLAELDVLLTSAVR
ncbi:TetR/AcrR family transcriptional regulator [Mycobacterium sp. pUA109]|uniref:TetR/AcrR family transcriptional regulator n=1 Tax=Mycobacterium sp. pUA109 TaxID=3238982 RepID=UPI00351B0042